MLNTCVENMNCTLRLEGGVTLTNWNIRSERDRLRVGETNLHNYEDNVLVQQICVVGKYVLLYTV